ncbi:MAG: response regulator transcription factor [Bacteroidetes bacterium]|nr:response regulator transcription factor [Bacteroidota bacterium]
MILNCVITDDEPVAQEILEDYINMIPGLNLVAKCGDSMETLSVLREHKIDVLFIDIQMPGVSGLDFIRSLQHPPAVVLTTAYNKYAIEGFDIDAADYLLKPISIERFLKTAEKLMKRIDNTESQHIYPTERKYMFVKVEQEYIKLEFTKILYIEGLENYVKIQTEDKAYISYRTLKSMEEQLPTSQFLRVHRSYIINLDKVESIQNHIFVIQNQPISIGKSYRKTIGDYLKLNSFTDK